MSNPIKHFTKEIIYKIYYFLFTYFMILIITYAKLKSIINFMLSPLINQHLNYVYIYNTKYNHQQINSKNDYDYQIIYNNINIPNLEINLPLLTSSTEYVKYILLCTIYFSIPTIIYFILITIKPLLKKHELSLLTIESIHISIFIMLNILSTQYIIIPSFLKFALNHYSEFLLYEFDIELQIINYIKIYFKILFGNVILYIICYLLIKKKKSNIISYAILSIIFILILPPDIMIYLELFFEVICFACIQRIIQNVKLNIKTKQYKQVEN